MPPLTAPSSSLTQPTQHTADTAPKQPTSLFGQQPLLEQLNRHILHGSVLLTGEAGIGKTCLLQQVFQQAQEQHSHLQHQYLTGVIPQKNLPPFSHALQIDTLHTHHTLDWFQQLNYALNQHAQWVLQDGLNRINQLNEQIGVQWTEDDLLKAIGLIKLQEEVDRATEPDTYIPRERIANALKSAMPVMKRFHFSAVNHCIKQLVQHLQDPWLYVASQLVSPTHPRLLAALEQPTPSPGASIYEQVDYQLAQWHARIQWIDSALPSHEPRVSVLIDHWEHLLQWEGPERNHLQQSLHTWIQQSQTHGTYAILACRSEAISQALQGSMLDLITNTCIVPALSYRHHRQLMVSLFQNRPTQLDSDAIDQLLQLAHGNPYWSGLLARYVSDRLHATQQNVLTVDWLQSLGLSSATEILETSLTQIKLSHMPYEADALRAIASLVREVGLAPFSAEPMARQIHQAQNLPLDRIITVIDQLTEYGLTTPCPSSRSAKPQLQISSRLVLEHLTQACQWIDTELTVDAQIQYLKKIIPLSIQSGELNRDKTQDVIALSTSTGQDELIQFLEETFRNHLDHPSEAVRITALNNLSMLHTEASLEGVLAKLTDPSPRVQEYAFRNIQYLCEKTMPPHWLDTITQHVLQRLDQENHVLRIMAYQALTALPINHHSQQLTAVYLKALTDRDDTIRQIAIQQLQHADQQSAWVRHATLDALHDPSDEIRHQACQNLRHNQHPKVLDALGKVLESDPNPTIRALSAKMLAERGELNQYHRLKDALSHDLDDDVQVTILRALQHFPNAETETFLVAFLERTIQHHPNPNTLLWACVQTLARIGQQPQTLAMLHHLHQQPLSPIVATAVESAMLALTDRIGSNQPAAPQASPSVIDVQPEMSL